jgi:hypothetical protein
MSKTCHYNWTRHIKTIFHSYCHTVRKQTNTLLFLTKERLIDKGSEILFEISKGRFYSSFFWLRFSQITVSLVLYYT